MRHQLYNPDFKFIKEPEEFNKYSDRDFLRFCLGATMYMPGFKDFSQKIIDNAMPALTSMVLDFEDACPEEKVGEAEDNTLAVLDRVADAIDAGEMDSAKLPLIFCRTRSVEQFEGFAKKLTKRQATMLTGFNFPKFNSQNADAYLSRLKVLSEELEEALYGMPIIEDSSVAFKETRMGELMRIRMMLDRYHDLILQVRVGGTDFSSCFGARRGVDYSIYDILTVREILSDILNVFSRENDYVVSGPVWEYFRAPKEFMCEELPSFDIQDRLLKRHKIFNEEVDGLLREVILDKANGFVGRTVIHPTHLKFVNALQAVTREEYEDAMQTLDTGGGVVKSARANKMNEIRPHTNWALKVAARAKAYGVIENELSYVALFSGKEG